MKGIFKGMLDLTEQYPKRCPCCLCSLSSPHTKSFPHPPLSSERVGPPRWALPGVSSHCRIRGILPHWGQTRQPYWGLQGQTIALGAAPLQLLEDPHGDWAAHVHCDWWKWLIQSVIDLIVNFSQWEISLNRPKVDSLKIRMVKSYVSENVEQASMVLNVSTKTFWASFLGLVKTVSLLKRIHY